LPALLSATPSSSGACALVQRAVPLLIVNRDPSVFSEMASESTQGHFIQASAAQVLPELVQIILQCARASSPEG
jgi:hypothetical protein